jgi:hypothetical protein
MSFERAKSHPNPASPSAIGQELLPLLGVPVDVLTRRALPKKLRATVLDEALPAYARQPTKAGGRPGGRHCGAQGTAFSSAAESEQVPNQDTIGEHSASDRRISIGGAAAWRVCSRSAARDPPGIVPLTIRNRAFPRPVDKVTMDPKSFVYSAVLLLIVASIAVAVFRHFGLGSILGLLVTGIIVGPHTPGPFVTTQVDDVRHFTELGVVLLLFLIGLEMKPRRLWELRRTLFGLGSLQIVVSTLVIACISSCSCQTGRPRC